MVSTSTILCKIPSFDVRREDFARLWAEAAELFWPKGPLRAASLRTAARDGQLAIAVIAGKFMTTKRALKEMARCFVMKGLSNDENHPFSAKTFVRHLVEATELRHVPTEIA